MRSWLLLAVFLPAFAFAAQPQTWTLTNHATDYIDELVRLKVEPPTPYDVRKLQVLEDGKPVPFQVEILEGEPERVKRGDLWVCTTIASKASHTYTVTLFDDVQPAIAAPARVTVTKADGAFTLDNGAIQLRLPAENKERALPAPILGIRQKDGTWVGGGAFSTKQPLKTFHAIDGGSGPLFAKISLVYEFESTDPAAPKFAAITVRLAPRQPFATIRETHAMDAGDHWTFQSRGDGWTPTQALLRGWYKAEGKLGAVSVDESLRVLPLAPNERLGRTFTYLQPRWTHSPDHAWFFAATDGKTLVGASPVRAGQWRWPYENWIECRLDEGGKGAEMVFPLGRGERMFFLFAAAREMANDGETVETPQGKMVRGSAIKEWVRRAAFESLDKLTHGYILEWPGQPAGGFNGRFFFDGLSANPIGKIVRNLGPLAVQSAKVGNVKPDRTQLSIVQSYFDADAFGYYQNGWSPIHPFYAGMMWRLPIARTSGLATHPSFKLFAAAAENAFRKDLDYSVTLPGGAGQECPEYLAHALEGWIDLAEVCRERLGFDAAAWPRYKAAASFLLHTSQPAGEGKRMILPLGETQPPGPDVVALAKRAGVEEKIESFVSEELPGFGAVLRSHPGTPKETFFAFKAGPNRMRTHGDSLSFHYCANGKKLAIDHMCGFVKRANQEHMHNRLSFGDYENLDGYERLIAFRSGPAIDVAVGQVESTRLRKLPKLPDDTVWMGRYETRTLPTPLTYRRTVALIKNPAKGTASDYVVIRDDYSGPEIAAGYCLHVTGEGCKIDGSRIVYDGLTLFCAQPTAPTVERIDWGFTIPRPNNAPAFTEKTLGVRLAVPAAAKGRFVTVLYPSATAPKMEALPSGVKITFDDGSIDTVLFDDAGDVPTAPRVSLIRGEEATAGLVAGDINLDRSQGEIGLFIPETGYDYGPLPDWLIRQRNGFPAGDR